MSQTKTEKLTRKQVISQIQKTYGIDISEGLRIKVDDHTGNHLAPETYCYKISYTQKWLGRQRFAWWPNTVGKQFWK